jgi:[protein-PII] uridylyltransferase
MRFLTTGDALALLHERCRLIDDTLCDLCQAVNLPASLAVLAVGGYGRGELYPASDVDLLILLPEQADDALTAQLERLVCLFWDIGLEIGHSVRTIEECLEQASGNITVQTSMIEARLLAGSASLFAGFSVRIKAALDAKNFFQTKRIEQEDRHQRFGETPYSLEANCKEGPGGLRDLQLILWTTQAAGYGNCWKDLERRGFITIDEEQLLESSEAFLRDLRTRLHLLAGRREDRLLFEYQTALAEQLGITATATQRASEQLMQRYYRRAKAVLQINAILLQNIGTRTGTSPGGATTADQRAFPECARAPRRGARRRLRRNPGGHPRGLPATPAACGPTRHDRPCAARPVACPHPDR